jgi:TRAP-type C4-dicarboxylate transport system substrate-binding protein
MNSIRATEKQLRKLQKQRHLYDIKMMILSNPIFKNLNDKDQNTLTKLVYKAEMIELYMRDRQILRINDSFDDIVENINELLGNTLRDDRDEDEEYRERDE